MSRAENKLAALEEEIRAEIAASLGRVAEKLEGFLAQLDRLAAAPRTPEVVAAHRAARAQAQLHHWYLVVQREAIGLRDHSRLPYVIPPRLEAG